MKGKLLQILPPSLENKVNRLKASLTSCKKHPAHQADLWKTGCKYSICASRTGVPALGHDALPCAGTFRNYLLRGARRGSMRGTVTSEGWQKSNDLL